MLFVVLYMSVPEGSRCGSSDTAPRLRPRTLQTQLVRKINLRMSPGISICCDSILLCTDAPQITLPKFPVPGCISTSTRTRSQLDIEHNFLPSCKCSEELQLCPMPHTKSHLARCSTESATNLRLTSVPQDQSRLPVIDESGHQTSDEHPKPHQYVKQTHRPVRRQ
jgi:hypothetical protein